MIVPSTRRWYLGGMKVKTSVSLSQELIEALKQRTSEGDRSDYIEKALWRFMELQRREERDKRDIELIELHRDELNAEAIDALRYQEPL